MDVRRVGGERRSGRRCRRNDDAAHRARSG
jgi:hypothetical protein